MLFDFRNHVDSPYNLGLFLKGGNNPAVEAFLQSRIAALCNDLGVKKFHLQQLPFESIFTDIEFNKQVPDENEESFINKQFYPKLFKELAKRKVTNENTGKEFWTLNHRTKYCFTLDRSLTPETSTSGIPYGILNLGNKPVLYYVWVDVQKIIDLIKST